MSLPTFPPLHPVISWEQFRCVLELIFILFFLNPSILGGGSSKRLCSLTTY